MGAVCVEGAAGAFFRIWGGLKDSLQMVIGGGRMGFSPLGLFFEGGGSDLLYIFSPCINLY